MRAALLIALYLFSGLCLAQARSGEQVWMDTCGYCHGRGIGPELRGRALPFETIRVWTRYGLRQMPAFSETAISDMELAELGEWMAAQPTPDEQENSHATP